MMATTTRSSISVNPDSFRNLKLSTCEILPSLIFSRLLVSLAAASYGNGGHKQLDHITLPFYPHLLGSAFGSVKFKMLGSKSRATQNPKTGKGTLLNDVTSATVEVRKIA